MEASAASPVQDAHLGEDERLAMELVCAGVTLGRVAQLMAGRLSEDELNKIARKMVTQGASRDPSLGLLVLERSKSAVQSSEFLSQHLASLTSDAPEELVDPLFFTLMKEPVVLSSGYVVDRSSVVDDCGHLKFSQCPFSRAELKKDVYPLVDRRRKLQEFKESRLDAMASTAKTMLEEKSFNNFQEVILAAEQFLDDLGEKTYIHKARHFAELQLEAVEEYGQEVPPMDLAKIYIRIHRTSKDDPQVLKGACNLSTSSSTALDKGQLDQASQYCDALESLQRSCGLASAGGSVARLRLEIARRRGEDLELPRRAVYRELVRDAVAAKQFLQEEGLNAEDIIDRSPIALSRARISDSQAGDEWRTAVSSPPLEGPVTKVIVQASRFSDQGWGNYKGNLGLALYDSGGSLIARCNLFGTYRSPDYTHGRSPERTLEQDQDVVSRAEPGHTYRLEYIVGGGGGHSLTVKRLLCRIYPAGSTSDLITCRLADPEGDMGIYLGPADENGTAHGHGLLHYDDNEVFVGDFAGGAMVEGALYGTNRSVRDTMSSGRWDEGRPNQNLVDTHTLNIEWLTIGDEAISDSDDYDEDDDEDEDEDDDSDDLDDLEDDVEF